MNHNDLELRYDGPIPPAMLEQARRSNVNPAFVRRLELEGIIARSDAEIARLDLVMKQAEDRNDEDSLTFLNIEHRYHSDRKAAADIQLRRLGK